MATTYTSREIRKALREAAQDVRKKYRTRGFLAGWALVVDRECTSLVAFVQTPDRLIHWPIAI